MGEFFLNLKTFFNRLSIGQRLGLVGVLAGGVIGLVLLAYWAQRPDYALMFGQLDRSEANQIVQALRTENIPYKLKGNGTTIFVPRERVHELRLRFAGEGIVSDGTTGYELFDQNTLGMTDFMQRINKKRALEGELARTITSLEQVESGRVHLVIPERSPFRTTQAQPSASVIVTLNGSMHLREPQIRGIVALVAGAVKGLEPENVVVLDTEGNILSTPLAGNEELQISSTHLRIEHEVEQHLTEKGQSMLDEVLGEGNAILRVSAELDFTESVSESRTIVPESQTVISEERLEETTDGAEASSIVRNYELSRSTTRVEDEIGTLSYLTVSVVLDHKLVPTPAGAEVQEPTYEPYTPAELQEIEQMVKNAIGFKPERGDRFSIHQTRFDTSTEQILAEEFRLQRRRERIRLYFRYGLMLLGIIAAAWLIRSTSKRVSETGIPIGELQSKRQPSPQLPGKTAKKAADDDAAGGIEDLVLVDDIYTSKLSPEARAQLKAKHRMFEEIQESVQDAPDGAANLIHTWLVEDNVKTERKARM